MTKYFYTAVVSVLFLGLVLVPHTYAETATSSTATTSVSVMLEKIKTLMAQLEELKKQLATVRGEVKETLKAGIPEGTNSDDMKKIQELLATDPSIYPEGKVTGYYGPLTKEALKRFQKRHDLEVTGSVDTETRDLLEEYLHEGYGNTIPPGLMRAPGIMQKVEDRFRLGCKEGERGHGMGPLCKKFNSKHSTSTEHMHADDDKDNILQHYNASSTDVMRASQGTTTIRIELDKYNRIGSFDLTYKGTGFGIINEYEGKASKKLTEMQIYDELINETANWLGVEVDNLDKELTQAIRLALKKELSTHKYYGKYEDPD